MAQNILERLWDMAMECFMIQTAQFMTENGMKIRNVEEVKCSFLMVHSTMGNGMEIRCMDKEFSFQLQEIDLKETFLMVWKWDMEQSSIIMEISTQDNGEMIKSGEKDNSNSKMEIIMMVTLLMVCLKVMEQCYLWVSGPIKVCLKEEIWTAKVGLNT